MKSFYAIAIVMIIFSCNTNKNISTYFIPNNLLGDTVNINNFGLDFLFSLPTDSVYEFHGKSYSIKKSLDWKSQNILWGSTYYTAKTHKSHYLFYLINKTPNSYEIVVDENGNLDFTDEKVQSKLTCLDSFTIGVYKNNSPIFKIFNRIVDTAIEGKVFESFKKDKMFPRHSSKIANLLQETRCNKKLVLLTDSNFITVEDYNCNGIFNDKDDRVIAYNDFTAKPISEKQTFSYKKGQILQYNKHNYLLKSIDKYGTEIKLEPTNKRLDFTNYFENIDLVTRDNKTIAYNALPKPKDYNVFYFWATWCKPCVETTDSTIYFYNTHKANINFYSINAGDKPETIEKYKNHKKIDFPIYSINQKNEALAKIEFFPQFIIIDSKGIIIGRTSSWKIAMQKIESLIKK